VSVFTEPTRALPLRWGTYRLRYLSGLALIVSGAIAIQGASAYVGFPLALGSLAHAVGWWVMPAAGWRRIWMVLPSLLSTIILLIGPAVVGILAVPFACWLIVRHRPAVTLLLALPVLVIGLLLRGVYAEYDGMLPALAVMAALMVACAWLARLAAASRPLHRQHKAPIT
jgi:hypothetical protein